MESINPNYPFRITGKNIRPGINKWFAVRRNQHLAIALALFVSFLIRIYLSQFEGYGYDIWIFKVWSRGVYHTGFAHFYNGIGSDYPPFYIYFLWAIGTFYKSFISFSFDIDSPVFTFLIKMPAMIADIFTAFLIFLIVRRYGSFSLAFLSMISYSFNPAIIYDSAIWGQVDSVYTLFLMLTLMLFVSNKPMLSGVCLALAILTKPQSLVLLPLFALYIIRKHSLFTSAKVAAASCAAFVAVALPFYQDRPIFGLFRHYSSSYIQYPYNSLNAFNLWAFTGMFQPDNTQFFGMTYRMWGYLLFGMIFIYVAYFILKNKDDMSIYISSAILFFAFFMFFTRIHERYLFPFFAPLAVAMTMDRRLSYVYILATITFLFNLYFVLEETKKGFGLFNGELLIPVAAGINLILLIFTIYCYSKKEKNHE
jgi:Gpi18-like mannosyltransferase